MVKLFLTVEMVKLFEKRLIDWRENLRNYLEIFAILKTYDEI